MVDIHLFGYVVDSTLLFQIVMPILAFLGLVIAYKNYRKKPATPPVSTHAPTTTFKDCTFYIQSMDSKRMKINLN